jgi:DNA invertase Pin-like site-specific DNA recombinase
MIVGYARISDKKQSLNRQIDALTSFGIDERNIYKEKGTGTKKDRPELLRLIDELKPSDTVVVAELTRISRSTKDLFEIVEQIQSKGADIKSLKENWLDTTTSHGKLMFTIFAGLSQFERDLISDRTKEGLAAAKARGRNGGRPSKRSEKELTVKILYEKGIKIAEIVRQTDLSRSTVNRIVKDIKDVAAAHQPPADMA